MGQKNPAANFFKPLPRAPPSFYGKAFAIGFAIGAALEFAVIKAGYYDIMRNSEARKVAKDRMEMEEAERKLDEMLKAKQH
ncbi:uncharacterized protein SPPG_09052 [Spizellomyces punctatus DAOM BR117]|uniref:Uncharacterized protein n=1 Tax=Spizellomyces punctatus (strain DAOM BR117) TaxID=645134 RepID=A0A0L0HMC5_SPIPD|nr:uncharacterized protein SPPG_09052 [Spizellomyces punctatus DAOM BR117]KND02223.1 hypothetical protein SPPG_09052 [Spizellomyces punctatus DAOM BR117]|eukprot:XP_016610262.1 hypothetical protein SPPG_09052 [Spizellomyces punctatus DAOM BR117]